VVWTGWSGVFLKHCQEVLLLFWFQEGGVLGIAWNTKETDAYAYDGDATFDYKNPGE
jgi:hypothetical protein